MKVIILAAGRGTRISKLIGDIPKCTVDVGGVPLIKRTITMLKNYGVSDISIVLGYKHNVVSEVIKGMGVKEYVNPFYHVTNSLGSLWFARENFRGSEDFIICNGDVFWTKEIFESISKSDKELVLLSDKKRVDDGDYFFQTDNKVLKAYGKELTRENRDCEYVGVAKISANMIESFKNRLLKMVDNQESDKWWENVLYSMVEERPIYVEDVGEAFWAEVDFIEDYNRILEYIKNTK